MFHEMRHLMMLTAALHPVGLAEAVRAYHGSPEANPVFMIGHTGTNSHTFGSYQSQRWGAFFSDNVDFAKMYGTVAAYDLNISRTLDCDNDNNVIWNFVQSFDPHDPADRPLWLDARAIMRDNHHWQLFEDEVGKRFVAYLRELGFDSAAFVEYNEDDHGQEHRSHTIVVLDPGLIVPLTRPAGETLREAVRLLEGRLDDLRASYSRLKLARDKLAASERPLPSGPDYKTATDAEWARHDRQMALWRKTRAIRSKRMIDLNHEIEVIKAEIGAERHRGTPKGLFPSYDSQKNGYQKTFVHNLGQMIDTADAALGFPANYAIDGFIGHTYTANPEGGTIGIMSGERLEDAFAPQPSKDGLLIRQQLAAAFAPIAAALRAEFGDTVTLHRAQQTLTGQEKPRYVLSWTGNLSFAEYHHKNLGDMAGEILTKTFPIEEIVWISDRANQAEFIVRNVK